MASKILVIGATGRMGKHVVQSSVKAGHTTFVLVRRSTLESDPAKANLVDSFKNLGVTILHRFFPSEFGMDVDKVNAVEPAMSMVVEKIQIRRAIEAEGIPYTYIACNCTNGSFLHNLIQLEPAGLTAPPRDKINILGEGHVTAVFNDEVDIGTYTIKAVDDPRTLNKILYIKPPGNTFSFNELGAMWEKLIGKTLEKIYIPEEQILTDIETYPVPTNIFLAINHSMFVRGVQNNYVIHPSFGVEASELYPEVKHTTVEEYLRRFI
ncbi:phenylcoumaran benzylic ether reductase TP7 isoform X2 [Capsicum annuum]|uniref:phenylcoumaran benzylic ether reductase TP7 isoform X2 n=1 Tax=Capsicum annuum TaxID=4072 RepID=UPI001FB06379|nr:phenylcoumaran benzylic ether reductase TP7 isoform X2 [Capsicum annuum]